MICDLAEYYHIYDYESVPPTTLVVLISGLDDRSRVMKKLMGVEVPIDTIMLGKIYDMLQAIGIGLGGGKQKYKPITPSFLTKKKQITQGYSTPRELNAARENILKGIKKHGSGLG